MFSRRHRSQLFATVFANLTTFAYGIAIGWPSPNLPRFLTDNTPLADKHVLTLDEVSWVGSIYMIGGTISSLVFGWMSERFGRKTTILVAAVPQVVAWGITEFGTSVNHLYLARLLVGFGGGGCFVCIPMYVSEIASDKIRGALGALIIVQSNLGLVIGYAVNFYLDYYTVPYIVIGILTVFFIGFPFAPESPKHLVMQRRMSEAERSLKYFRGYSKSNNNSLSKEFQDELQVLQSLTKTSDGSDESKLTWQDFTCKSARKAIFISFFLTFLTIANGVVAIVNYSETIFVEAGSTLGPEMSSIIIALILLFGSYTSSILSDRAGRRVLMGISSTGCGLSLAIMGIFSYLKAHDYPFHGLTWIPLACLSAFMLLGSIGIMSLHYVIISEVLTQKIRGVVCTVCQIENWFLAFLSVKFFPVLLEVIKMQGCMLVFSTICFSGSLFVLFILPETKGKRIETIIKELEGK